MDNCTKQFLPSRMDGVVRLGTTPDNPEQRFTIFANGRRYDNQLATVIATSNSSGSRIYEAILETEDRDLHFFFCLTYVGKRPRTMVPEQYVAMSEQEADLFRSLNKPFLFKHFSWK